MPPGLPVLKGYRRSTLILGGDGRSSSTAAAESPLPVSIGPYRDFDSPILRTQLPIYSARHLVALCHYRRQGPATDLRPTSSPNKRPPRLPLPHWRHHHRPLLHTGNSSKNRAISLATTAPTPCEHFHPTNDLGSTPRRQSTRSLAPQLTRPTWPHCQRTGLTGRRKDR